MNFGKWEFQERNFEKIKLKNWKFGKIILKMEFQKIKFKNWKFGKLGFRE